jgi:DNA repair protein RadA/Sms
MVIAVLEAHAGLKLGQHDVYLNVAGGLRITEPAADLAAAAALISSLAGTPLPPDRVYMGEIGLTGALRPVSQTAARLKEAAKLGFASALAPKAGREAAGSPPIRLDGAADVADLVAGIASGTRKARA